MISTLSKNSFFRILAWGTIYLAVIWSVGCAKKLSPEVEPTPEPIPVVSNETQEPTTETVTEVVPESGFNIDEQDTTVGSSFETESGTVEEQVNNFIETPMEERGLEETTIPDIEVEENIVEETNPIEVMDLKSKVYVAEGMEGQQETSPEETTPEETTPGETIIPDFGIHDSENFGQSNETMNLQDKVFEAEPQEETPVIENTAEMFTEENVEKTEDTIEEARLLDFEPTEEMTDIHFAFDRYDLDATTKSILRTNAEWLKNNPGTKVEIEGHCDERGTNNYNLGLGERRALATKKFLMEQGIDEDRLRTISYGEEKPFCFESNDDCWKLNRRAHFLVSE